MSFWLLVLVNLNSSQVSSCPLKGRSIHQCLGSPPCPPPCPPVQRTQAWMTRHTAAPWRSQRLLWRERSDWLWRERNDTAGRGGWLHRAWLYPGNNKVLFLFCCTWSQWVLFSNIKQFFRLVSLWNPTQQYSIMQSLWNSKKSCTRECRGVWGWSRLSGGIDWSGFHHIIHFGRVLMDKTNWNWDIYAEKFPVWATWLFLIIHL